MLNVAHLESSYSDLALPIQLVDETDALLSHYYPDLDEMMDKLTADSDWVEETLALAGIVDTETMPDDDRARPLLWGLSWGTYLMGADLVKRYLAIEPKAMMQALTIAGVDPEMFAAGSERAPLYRWFGVFVGCYAVAAWMDRNDLLDEESSEMHADIIAEGFLNSEVEDEDLRYQATVAALEHIRSFFNQVAMASGMPTNQEMH